MKTRKSYAQRIVDGINERERKIKKAKEMGLLLSFREWVTEQTGIDDEPSRYVESSSWNHEYRLYVEEVIFGID